MSVVSQLDVRVDPRIKQDARLAEAVALATAFLETKTAEAGPPARVRWTAAGLDKDTGRTTAVALDLFDAPTGDEPDAHRSFRVDWLLDQASREIAVLQAWGDLISRRADRRTPRINLLLNRLREEEADGREVSG